MLSVLDVANVYGRFLLFFTDSRYKVSYAQTSTVNLLLYGTGPTVHFHANLFRSSNFERSKFQTS